MGAEQEYERLTPLATGGMAELLLAARRGAPGFRKLVVLKRVLPVYAADPSFTRMFLREARIAASLDHPNVVQVYDSGTLQGQTFLAMEYVHGVDLRELLRSLAGTDQVVSLPHLLTLAVGICAGLHYVHECRSPKGEPLGLIHRDLSPSNVLVSYEGAIKLADFGVAAASAESIATRSGAIKGKLAYMAPEQARGDAIDRRADIFGLGAVLYELSTGRRPFVADNDAALLYQVLEAQPEPPSEQVEGYPAKLEAIVMRALAKDPAARHSTAQALQLELEQLALDLGLPLSPLRLGHYVVQTCGDRPTPRLSGETTLVAGGSEEEATRVELAAIASNVTRRRPRRSTLWITAATVGLTVGVLATWGATTWRADASASVTPPSEAEQSGAGIGARSEEGPSVTVQEPEAPVEEVIPDDAAAVEADASTGEVPAEAAVPTEQPRAEPKRRRRPRRRSTKPKSDPGPLDSPLPGGR